MDDSRPDPEPEHGPDEERADEGATQGDIGALDGAAAAGSAGAVSAPSDGEAPVPEEGPDP